MNILAKDSRPLKTARANLHSQAAAGRVGRIGIEMVRENILPAFVVIHYEISFKIGIQHTVSEVAIPSPIPILGRSGQLEGHVVGSSLRAGLD